MEKQHRESINNEQQFDIRNGVLFRYNGNDTAVSIPSSVRTITSLAFKNCQNVSNIYVPDTVTCIEDYAFVHCSSLRCVTLGFGVRNVPKGCFSGLRELETVILTDNIESLDDFAFDNCTSLKSLNFITKKHRDPVTPAEKGKAYEAMLLGGKAQIEYIDYTDTVPAIKNVGRYAFAGCSNLNYDAIESATETIGINAFDKKTKKETSITSPETNIKISTESKKTVNNAEDSQLVQTDNLLDEVQMAKEPLRNCDQRYLIEGYAVVGDNILNCTTGQTVPDCNISGMDMDFTSTLILRRAGQLYGDTITLSQILQIQPNQLSSVKRATPAQIKKAVKQLRDLLESLFNSRSVKQPERMPYPTMPVKTETVAVESDTQDGTAGAQEVIIEKDESTSSTMPEDSVLRENLAENTVADDYPYEQTYADTSTEESCETLDESENEQSGNIENDDGIPAEDAEEIATKEETLEDINQEVCLPDSSDAVSLVDEPEMDENEALPDISHYDSVDDNHDAVANKRDLPETDGFTADAEEPEFEPLGDNIPQYLIDGYAVTDGKIVDCNTGRTIPDQYISDRDMDPTSIIILRRAGGIYSDSMLLSQALQLHLSQLQSVRNAKAAQVENTLNQLKELLEALFAPRIVVCKSVTEKVSNDAVMHGCDTNAYSVGIEQSAAIAENENDRQNKSIPPVYLSEETSEDPHSLIAKIEDDPIYDEIDSQEQSEPLIRGFDVINGIIYRTDTNQQIEDAAIAVLNLSTRAYNCLGRTRAYTTGKREDVMISTVLGHTPTGLRKIRNMGAKTAEEIIDKIRQYLLMHSGCCESNTQEIKNTIAPNYEIIDGIITNVVTQCVVPDVSVYNLNLSTRAGSSLYRGGIRMLSELIVLTQQQLRNISNLGSKSLAEIIECVPAYLKAHEEEKNEIDIDHSTKNDENPVLVLPEINPDIPVLAAEYAVVDGMIICRSDYSRIADAPIEVLNLSVRATNCLERSGLTKLSMLIGLPYSEFRNIRNLGALSANEIQEKLELYLSRCCSAAESNISQGTIYSSGDVLRVLKEHEYESLSLSMICEALPNANEEDILQLVEHLLRDGSIEKEGNTYNVYHRSFVESMSTLAEDASLDERAASILQLRSNGVTLEEVGQRFGITRERVRQIEKKAMDKLTRRGRVHFEEDKYAYFFTTYAMDKELFFDYLQETEQVWYYLTTRYSKGKEELSKAIDDPNVSVELRRIADRFIHRGYIQVDGVYFPALRGDIEDYVVEKYCKDEVSIDDFFLLYDKFLQANDITDERFQVTESTRATRSNRLSESNKILWKQNQRFRYYDIQSGDYTELLEVLNLSQYTDIELSTRKFLMDYPELMSRYDLRDEYEIHNLLKKIHAEKENPDMIFSRMPNIIFGVFDRDAAVKEMLFALAPISQEDLAEAISEEYGTRSETIKANWLTGISEYYHQGMYSVDYEDMPKEHVLKLQEILTDDFYYLSELRKLYARTIPDADMSLLSTYNLKKMGFLIGSSYVLQNYPTAEAYFDHLLTGPDIVDISPLNRRYGQLSTYTLYLSGLKREMEIIEFEPFQYINIRRLQKIGYDKECLRSYADRVWSFLLDDEFFTVQSLRKAGFGDELDMLGFNDLFYSSLLREDSRFTWQRIGKTVVLNPKGTQFNVHDFLVDRVIKEEAIDVDDFVAMLQEVYGISLDRHDVLHQVKGSDVYYDSIMGKLYADYSTYFEEV